MFKDGMHVGQMGILNAIYAPPDCSPYSRRAYIKRRCIVTLMHHMQNYKGLRMDVHQLFQIEALLTQQELIILKNQHQTTICYR